VISTIRLLIIVVSGSANATSFAIACYETDESLVCVQSDEPPSELDLYCAEHPDSEECKEQPPSELDLYCAEHPDSEECKEQPPTEDADPSAFLGFDFPAVVFFFIAFAVAVILAFRLARKRLSRPKSQK